jgi:alkylation response protein AidB-like acyl-CoA dehydrogenase
MDERVLPNEPILDREDDDAARLVDELRDEVRAQGLWAPHVPPEAGGTGTGFLDYAYLNEYIGRDSWSSAARRPTPATPRSSTCSARTTRSSDG